MKDKAKEIAIPAAMTIPKVKGHTRIELTNAKTGEKKVIEHENTFQSAVIAKQLRSLGAVKNSPWNNNTWAGRPLWRNLCGGILLFRDAIDLTNGDVEYMPSSNLMVANGAYGVVNNGNPPELGSYNSIESSTGGRNSLSFVYDWGTSQGNGTIGCICLTSETGGFVGYGNASGYNATLRNIFENQEGTYNGAHLYYNGQKIRIVSVDYSTKKITVAKGIDGVTKASVFLNQDDVETEVSYTGNPIGSGTSNTFARPVSSTEIMVFKSAQADTIPNGSSGGILIYDASNDTASVVTITNTSGKIVYPYSSNGLGVEKDADGNFLIKASDNSVAVFDETGVFVELLSNCGGDSGVNGQITPDIVAAAKGSGGTSPLYFIYGSDVLPTNGMSSLNFMYNAALDAVCLHEAPHLIARSIMPRKNPLYLATVNNLNSAVVKDNTQTMKVIYTLTEA